MKAPFSCPNNSEAISSRGIAAQFTLMNARVLRSDRRWMARATSSLPVPVSPVMSTVESLRATLETRESTALQSSRCSNNLFEHRGLIDFFAQCDVLVLQPLFSSLAVFNVG